MSTIAVTNLKHESAAGNNITLTSGGQVGVGTTTTNGQVNIAKSGGNQLSLIDSSGSSPGIRFADSSNAALAFIESPAAAGLAFFSGSTERMRIDSAGRVTKPYQPAFVVNASGSNTTLPSNDAIVVLNSEVLDVGNDFNTSTYRFTAPVRGVYVFSYRSTLVYSSGSGGSYNAVYLKVNNSFLNASRCRNNPPATSQWTSHQGTWIVELYANDYVDVWEYSENAGQITRYWNETQFSGYLLG